MADVLQDLDPYALLPRLEEFLLPYTKADDRYKATWATNSLEAWRRSAALGALASPAAPAAVETLLREGSIVGSYEVMKALAERRDILADPFLLEVLLTSWTRSEARTFQDPMPREALVDALQERYLSLSSIYAGYLRGTPSEVFTWASTFLDLVDPQWYQDEFRSLFQGAVAPFMKALLEMAHEGLHRTRVHELLHEGLRQEAGGWWTTQEDAHLALTALYLFHQNPFSLFKSAVHHGGHLDACDRLLAEELLVRLLQEEGPRGFLRFAKTIIPLYGEVPLMGLALYVKELPSFRAMPPSWWLPLLQEA